MGKKIENYVLETVVGEGEFGKVFKAYNEKTGQEVAVKVIRIQKFRMSPKLEEFTINQIHTLSKLDDTKHIVKFIEILKTVNNYYFVYEFCNGGTLEQQIKYQGRFTEQKALTLFKELLNAFRILVRNNVMHRDIKPSNILLHNGVIKLADFGFCKPLKDSRDLAQTMLGSPIYMAPEILKGEVYTMKADIWSLGVVLYEMLYGYCPFEERTIARLVSAIDENTVVFNPTVKTSRKVEDLLLKMLVKDQFKRITWEQLFDYDLSIEPEAILRPNPFMKKNPATRSDTPLSELSQKSIPVSELTAKNTPSANENYQKANSAAETLTESSKPKEWAHHHKQTKQNNALEPVRRINPTIIRLRERILEGLKLIREVLTFTNSKISVGVCCYLAQKIRSIGLILSEQLKQGTHDKENLGSTMTSEVVRAMTACKEQLSRLTEKLKPFERELQSIEQPLQILFLRFGEQQKLTQQKEGLIRLLSMHDFLFSETKQDYYGWARKSLHDQYSKRVLQRV